MSEINRQLFFREQPQGEPQPTTFAVRELPVPQPGEGELLCRNVYVSVDPYLRLKMHQRESYTPPLEIGQAIPGLSVAEVVTSRAEGWKAGELVSIAGGWQDYAVVPARRAQRVDATIAAPTAWLSAMGMIGMTAYAGLKEICQPVAGETLVVSAAAGAVGGLAGQIGKALGCRVVGIAGTQHKCDFVREELGFDECVDYKAADWEERLRAALPQGADMYFDNVGGTVSAAAFRLLRPFGRMAICGLISQYNGQGSSAPNALDEWMRWILVRRLTVRGFIATDLVPRYPEFAETMGGWLREGRVRVREQMHQGFDQIVPAFLGMLRGDNVGKTLVRIA